MKRIAITVFSLFLMVSTFAADNNNGGVFKSLFGGENEEPPFMMATNIIFLLLFVSIVIGLFAIVAMMAKQRHRNVGLWILLSILATPLPIIFILLAIGNDESKDLNYKP
jgi:hypothetical protein